MTARPLPRRPRAREAVLLAGGLGTRLRAVIGDRPKALVEVGGRPFLFRLLDALAARGIERAILALGHGADRVLDALGDWNPTLEITPRVEPTRLGTGGALRHGAEVVRGESFFGLNGDSLTTLDFAGLEEALRRTGVAAIQVTRVPNAARFGTVEFDASGLLVGFQEKAGRTGPGWISAGVYAFDKAGFLSDTAEGPFSIEHDYFMKAPRGRIAVFPLVGEFVDIGTEASLVDAASIVDRILGAADAPDDRRGA